MGNTSLALPNDTNLIGFSIYLRSVTLSPSVNSLGIAASKGLPIEPGPY